MQPDALTSAEIFSGCGGLALGLSRAGFKHSLLVEWDHDAAETVAHNIKRNLEHVADWPYEREDVRNVDWTHHKNVDVLAGGPPCQPFGIGGKALGPDDERDMWPEAVRAVREAEPTAFAFENVFGLLRERFEGYVAWVRASLERPYLTRKLKESHEEHLKRLTQSRRPKTYHVVIQSVNAAEFGAAQNRRRILFLGVRADAGFEPPMLKRTHSRERLIWDQFVSGEYWERHEIEPRKPLLQVDASLAQRLKTSLVQPPGKAWVTIRDVFHDLGEPEGKNGHMFQGGARTYPGHTGSPLDLPAKALKAGDHGVPGGENMMFRDDGTVRYFTIRESARLMGLPDDYEFPRSWTESMRQMGNAVPVQLAEAVGKWLADQVSNANATKKSAA